MVATPDTKGYFGTTQQTCDQGIGVDGRGPHMQKPTTNV